MRLLENILKDAVERGVSDVYIYPSVPVRYRKDGQIHETDLVFSRFEIASMIESEVVRAHGAESRLYIPQEIDVSYSLKIREGYSVSEEYRFRINMGIADGEPFMVIRQLGVVQPDPSLYGIPQRVVSAVETIPYGLFLCTGATGMGKSTTLACLAGYLCQQSPKVVVTIEDPIEYRIQAPDSLILQREVGRDTRSFATGLKAAVRENPDIILVGEIRDAETAVAAINAAKTGHLVLSTLHLGRAENVASRISGMFELTRRDWVVMELMDVLCAVVVQVLVPKAAGGRILCTEFLDCTAVKDLFASADRTEIRRLMRTSPEVGWTLNSSLIQRYQEGDITREMIYRYTNCLEELNVPDNCGVSH